MTSRSLRSFWLWTASIALIGSSYAEDLHLKRNISVGGYIVSTSESSIKGARERTVTQGPNGSTITLRQCNLKRTLTLNEQAQTYFVNNDPQDENAAKAAALATGAVAPESSGGKVTVTTTLTDTGERNTLYGMTARHVKGKIAQEPSAEACTQVRQSFEIDSWVTDLSKEQAGCAALAPPVQQGSGCHDTIIARRVGSGKAGYPLVEDITMPNPDGTNTTVTIRVSEITKGELPPEMFDLPAGYRQVNSLAELNGAPAAAPQPAQVQMPIPQQQQAFVPPTLSGQQSFHPSAAQLMNPMTGPATQMAMQQQFLAQASQMGVAGNISGGMHGGMPNMGANQATSAPVASPQALGPKAPGKIRIGVAPPEAQLGQGSNASADYSTPIRNAEIALMSGPAIEIAALDSHIPVQLQAEAQQKQCDYILFSSVAVKHSQGGGFGKFAKMSSLAASMTPMGGMAHGMGGTMAAQAAGMAASQMAQQQAMSQLAGFNNQIKSKDDVTVQYQLVGTGQSTPAMQNSLQGKAKSDGEDVLTPLLEQAANEVLTQVSKK